MASYVTLVNMADNTTSSTANENKEGTTLLWLDPSIESHENPESTKQELRLINDYVRFDTDLEACVAYIQSNKNEKIFFITSGTKAAQILPRITNLRHIDSIFIFCTKIEGHLLLTNQYSKVIGVYNDRQVLYKSIQEQIDLADKQLQKFSFCDRHQQPTKELSKQEAEFLWYQLFNRVISRLPKDGQAKQQMIKACRLYYRGNTKELQLIDQFEREYQSEEAIRWYMRSFFIHKLVNKALRTKDIDQLRMFRFFIGDISACLAREYEKLLSSEERIITVYRGTKLDKETLEQLKQNQGKLLSTNGYLLTTRLRPQALAFATKSTKRTDLISVLFEIQCNLKELEKSILLGDISQFSENPDEQQILFDLNAAFRLEFIEEDAGVQLIRMSATKAGETIANNYLEAVQQETEGKTISIVFGRLLSDLGQYDESQKYFDILLKNLNNEDISWIEFYLGRALHYKGQWKEAREYYDWAYNRMINSEPVRIKDSAYVLNYISNILYRQEAYDDALDYCEQALKLWEKYYPTGHIDIATNLNNIGNILYTQGKYEKALDYYKQALKIRETYYPSGHVDIASSLNNIANILCNQRRYSEAYEYSQRSLKMLQKFYPFGHLDMANTYNNIGNILYSQKKYPEALDFYRRALNMWEKYNPSDHVDIAASLNNIGNILTRQGKYDEALNYCQRSLKMSEKYYPSDHIEIASCLSNIGNILYNQAKYDEALDYFQHTLDIQQKYYPSDHVDIGLTLHNIGRCYEREDDSKSAHDYFQRALNVYEKVLPAGHPELVKTEQDIRRVTEKCVIM